MTMEAKTDILNISRCNVFPFIEILKNVCPHQVHKLWVKLKTIPKGETNLVHIGTKKMFDPYKMMGCLNN
jgi:hypothetical protein